MLDKLESIPILPIYRQSEPNEPIDFGSIAVKFSNSSPDSPTAAHARIRFTPDDELVFLTRASDQGEILNRFFGSGSNDIVLHFVDFGTSVRVFSVGSDGEHEVLHPTRIPVDIRRATTPAQRVVFHLVNWPSFIGPDDFVLSTGTAPLQGGRRCGRIFLKADGWAITIVEVEGLKSLLEALKVKGGYAITHVGEIRRQDAASFAVDEADALLFLLRYFFSFALGRCSAPTLPVGFDATGERTLESWGFGTLASGPWSAATSWFDCHHSECLAEALPGFSTLWQNEVWQRPLRDVIYWYNGASQLGSGVNVDSALLFTQAALELLAWTYCVQFRCMVSADAFRPRGLKAADKLRILASALDIPLDIPAEMKALHSRRGQKWVDSMDAITDLRNGLVHPGKDRTIPDGAYYDAWRLSLWYIDMILLRLCRYTGKYANRLKQRWIGDVESVPWVSCDP